MMNFFPSLYEDELLYSVIARYKVMTGMISEKALIKDIYGKQVTVSSPYFPTHLSKLIKNLPYSSKVKEEYLIKKHTLYPFFTSFLDEDMTKRIYNSVKEGDNKRVILNMGINNSGIYMNKYFKFCPECLKEDIKIFGESYWRRLHQIPGVLFCIKHKCKLLDSTVMAVNTRVSQECANINTCVVTKVEAPELERFKLLNLELTAQIKYILNNEIERKNLDFIIKYYIDRLREKGYTSASGNIYMKGLEREFIEFYSHEYLSILQVDMDINKNNNWLRTFVRESKKNRNPIKHLLLLQFLGLKAEDLFSCTKAVGKKQVVYSFKPRLEIEDMRRKWTKIIEENPGASRTELKNIGKGLRTWLYRNDKEWYEKTLPEPRKKVGQSSFVDWEKRDEEYLSLSKKAVKELLNTEEKPIRITKGVIRRHLGLNTKFNNERLIETHKYIKKVEEDIVSYRIRKIRWAIAEMEKNGLIITPYKVQVFAGFGGGNELGVRGLIEAEITKQSYK